MKAKDYEVFSTTADVGIRVWGVDFGELYSHAVQACRELLFGENGMLPSPDGVHRLRFRGDGCENVLVNLLSEVLFLVYEKHRMAVGLDLHVAKACELDVDILLCPQPHRPLLEIKSVTYHNLAVRPEGTGWTVEIVMDV